MNRQQKVYDVGQQEYFKWAKKRIKFAEIKKIIYDTYMKKQLFKSKIYAFKTF